MFLDEATSAEPTAYLDGELAPEARRAIEDRIAHDPEFRAELHRMERTWALLDRLPRATVDDSFSRTTMEMVAIDAERETRTETLELPKRRRQAAALGIVAVAVASGLGLLLGLWAWPDQNRRLLADLPVIQDFEKLQHIDSVEFVRNLQKSAFPADATASIVAEDSPLGVDLSAKSTLEDRRQAIENLTVSEQQQLLRSDERFAALPPNEQARLRSLQQAIDAAEDAVVLHSVADRYYEWLKTLTPSQRAELADLPADARLARIQSLIAKQKQAEERRRPQPTERELPSEDIRVLRTWFEQLAWTHREDLLDKMQPDRRKKFEKLNESEQRKALVMVAVVRSKQMPLPITSEDIAKLSKQLSPGARERLQQAREPQQQRRLMRQWLMQAVADRAINNSRHPFRPRVDREELESFFAKDLSADEREKLTNLPSDRMAEELNRLYYEHAMRQDDRRDPPEFMRQPDGRRGPPDFRRGPPDERYGPPPGERGPGPRGFRLPPPEDRAPPRDEPRPSK